MMPGVIDGRPRRGLNLGCGKVLFPSTAEDRAEQSGLAEEWVNADHAALPGVDRVLDAFAYPWPFEDGEFDHIYCSHLIEHIPHEARPARNVTDDPALTQEERFTRYEQWNDRQQELLRLDGFFAFFAEAYRVLRPGGTIYCEVPYGTSMGAMQDPTHTRFIVASTLSYLLRQESGTFDYQLPFAWEVSGYPVYGIHQDYVGVPFEKVQADARRMFDVILTFSWTLRKIPMDAGAHTIEELGGEPVILPGGLSGLE
jgi:SAM-dependent methyltransferase